MTGSGLGGPIKCLNTEATQGNGGVYSNRRRYGSLAEA